MSSVVIAGDTSGTVTLQAPSVAGTTTLTLPSTSGTVPIYTGGTPSSSTYLRGDNTWATPTSGGMTLLYTFNGTSGGNSVAISGLDLSSYQSLYVVSNALSMNVGNNAWMNGNNTQDQGARIVFLSPVSQDYGTYGYYHVDLASGIAVGYNVYTNTGTPGLNVTTNAPTFVTCAITNSSTTIYLRGSSTGVFDAGTLKIYGVK